jgi:hypothetical protein
MEGTLCMAKIPALTRIVGTTDIPQQRKVPKMIRVPAKTPIYGAVVSDAIFGLTTHFIGGRTVLCAGEDECEFHDDSSTKWYGLIAVASSANGVEWVQLTPAASESLLRQLQLAQQPLFRTVVRLTRSRPVFNAPIVVHVDPNARVASGITRPITPEETLELVFNSPKSSPKPVLKVV